MPLLMEALRTFSGTEGFFRRGERFNVSSGERARQLSQHGLAKMVEEETPNTEPLPNEPTDEPASEETPLADAPAPSREETWGITATGGGWYELPSGEKIQGFEQAKERLFQLLSSEYVQPEEAKVQLIEPVDGPNIVWTDDAVPVEEETPTNSEPSETEETRKFEDEVRYLGGGWYELPNGERVQGKESARDVWEIYIGERG